MGTSRPGGRSTGSAEGIDDLAGHTGPSNRRLTSDKNQTAPPPSTKELDARDKRQKPKRRAPGPSGKKPAGGRISPPTDSPPPTDPE
jgi:hypothetical protein